MSEPSRNDVEITHNSGSEDRAAKSPKNRRLVGAGLASLGVAMGYFFVYLKAVDVMGGVEEVSYSYKAMMIAPFCTVMGIYYMLCRPSGANAWKDMEPADKPFLLSALVLSVGGMFGLWFWFERLLAQHGYL